MRSRLALPVAALLTAFAPAAAHAATFGDGHGVHAEVTATSVSVGNGLIDRTWSRSALRSTIVDHRGGDRTWSADQPDFTLTVADQPISSADFKVDEVNVYDLDRGGLRLVMKLSHAVPALTATRTVEVYPGVAGFRTQTTVASPVPLVLSAATTDEVAVGSGVTSTIHAFRAGWDWREPNWAGPSSGSIGDPHAGDWRASASAAAGQALSAPGEWLSAAAGDRSVFEVLERNDFPSSRAVYDGRVATTRVDFTRDIISLGPLEETGHVENPSDQTAGRGRVITAAGLALPASFTGLADGDGDEGWQFHKYLVEDRIVPYPHDVVFNSDGTDANRISTGAKDDMDYATVQQVAPLARRMGADVFTLDDGWQAASGDWIPDSPDHRDPRVNNPAYQGDKSKLAPRFPDATFMKVREAIAPMKLGLWMSPMAFNTGSDVYRAHPNWGCNPTGQGFGAYSSTDPDSSSNEAGLGLWSTDYIPFLEGRLRDAIANWHVKLFKFDFLVWLDCVGANDIWEMHDQFLAMIDRLRLDFPQVAFAIDETNDYRLFPFESTLRGPTWFSNAGPTVADVLHTTWSMSPWVPGFSLGMKTLTGAQRNNGQSVATSVAASLVNEQMVADDLRSISPATLDEAKPWLDWGKAHRDDLDGVIYPLLADPLQNTWTALQSWDPERGRGVLLAFRQGDARDSTTIALRNVPDGTYELTAAPDDAPAGTVDASELRSGLTVALPPRGARVLLIKRLG